MLWVQWLANVMFSAWYKVEGASMLPTLAYGESVLVVRARFPWNRLRRGDVVLLKGLGAAGSPFVGTYVKRIVGLPGEDLRMVEGKIFVGGEAISEGYLAAETEVDRTEPDSAGPDSAGPDSAGGDSAGGDLAGSGGEAISEWWNGPEDYVVLGDNRAESGDSRRFGPVPARMIIGKVWFRCWPPRSWGFVRRGD